MISNGEGEIERKLPKKIETFLKNYSKTFCSFRPFNIISRCCAFFGPKISIFQPFEDFYLDLGAGNRVLFITAGGWVICISNTSYRSAEQTSSEHFQTIFRPFSDHFEIVFGPQTIWSVLGLFGGLV